MDRMTGSSAGSARPGGRSPTRRAARLATTTGLGAILSGSLATANLAATSDAAPTRSGPPEQPLGLVLLAGVIVALAFMGAVVRRRRAAGETAHVPEPALFDPRIEDFDMLLAAARAAPPRPYDGRGSLSTDRAGDVDDEPVAAIDSMRPGPAERAAGGPEAGGEVIPAPSVPASAPVWVRRLDGRIPVMPTIQTLPVDHDVEGHGRPPPSRVRRGR
jgi:hypothetical protein